MKKPPLLLTIALAACLMACKSKTTGTLASGDENGVRQSQDTVPRLNRDTSFYIPPATGYVNDFVGLFTEPQRKSLDSLVRSYEKQGIAETSIVTVDSSWANHQNFEQYTLQMANAWGLGKKKNNNGILIAISPHLRRMRIQNGFGIEKLISDQETKAIVDSFFLPNLKKGDYFEGTRQGLIALMSRLR